MNELITFFAPSIVLSFMLVGIHCYLGLHVLKRQVIFVDLSLAQVAALGYAFAALWGMETHELGSYFVALAFTFVAALFFSFASRIKEKISQEVVIGITFAFASSLSVLVLNKQGHGAEHIKEMLVGRLLWVSWHEVFKVSIIYSLVGIIHYIYRAKFFNIKNESSFWNFLFYALFGFVITSSVGTAGLLLVFSFLIVPGTISSLFFEKIKTRLFVGWGIGALLTVVGLLASYYLDVPMGAVTVALFTTTIIVIILVNSLIKQK